MDFHIQLCLREGECEVSTINGKVNGKVKGIYDNLVCSQNNLLIFQSRLNVESLPERQEIWIIYI